MNNAIMGLIILKDIPFIDRDKSLVTYTGGQVKLLYSSFSYNIVLNILTHKFPRQALV